MLYSPVLSVQRPYSRRVNWAGLERRLESQVSSRCCCICRCRTQSLSILHTRKHLWRQDWKWVGREKQTWTGFVAFCHLRLHSIAALVVKQLVWNFSSAFAFNLCCATEPMTTGPCIPNTFFCKDRKWNFISVAWNLLMFTWAFLVEADLGPHSLLPIGYLSHIPDSLATGCTALTLYQAISVAVLLGCCGEVTCASIPRRLQHRPILCLHTVDAASLGTFAPITPVAQLTVNCEANLENFRE